MTALNKLFRLESDCPEFEEILNGIKKSYLDTPFIQEIVKRGEHIFDETEFAQFVEDKLEKIPIEFFIGRHYLYPDLPVFLMPGYIHSNAGEKKFSELVNRELKDWEKSTGVYVFRNNSKKVIIEYLTSGLIVRHAYPAGTSVDAEWGEGDTLKVMQCGSYRKAIFGI